MWRPAARSRCPRCAGTGADLRGWLTALGTVGVFTLALVRSASGVPADDVLPPWAAGYLTLITTGYYMTKGAERMANALRRGDTPPPD